MAYDTYFGFDLTQRKTLERLLESESDANTVFLQAVLGSISAWSETLVAKLNADAGVTDTDYEGLPSGGGVA